MKIFASVVATFLICVATTLAIAPNLVPFQCSGGGSGWMVFEDLDNNGYYDWVTIRACDGSITHGPFPPPEGNRVVGSVLTSPPSSIDFSYTSCPGSSTTSWEVVELDGSGQVTARVSKDCNSSISVSYPPTTYPLQGKDLESPKDDRGNMMDVLNNIIASPNPSDRNSTKLTLSVPVSVEGALTVKIFNINGQTVYLSSANPDQLLQGLVVNTSLMPAGTYSVVVEDAKNTIVATEKLVVTR